MAGRSVLPESSMYDAVSYLTSVEEAFHGEPAKYDEFFNLFTDVTVLRVYVPSGVARMKELIKDHQNLLLSLNVFLPPEAMVGRSAPAEPIKEDLLSYFTAVKEAFHDEPAKYDEFLMLFYEITHKRVFNIAGSIGKMVELLKDHQNLLLRLADAQTQRILHLMIEQRAASDDNKRKRVANFIGKLKARFQGDDRHVYESFLEILKMYKAGNKSIYALYHEVDALVQGHEDLVMEFSGILSLPSGSIRKE